MAHIDRASAVQIDPIGARFGGQRDGSDALLDVVRRDLNAEQALVGRAPQPRLLLFVVVEQHSRKHHLADTDPHAEVGAESPEREVAAARERGEDHLALHAYAEQLVGRSRRDHIAGVLPPPRALPGEKRFPLYCSSSSRNKKIPIL
eukprot:scaffold18693_cov101-Isochrysis_galbana.AAC.2